MADKENTPETGTENEAVDNPKEDRRPTQRARRERPPREERVKPTRERRERPERERRERPERVRAERPERVKTERPKREKPPFDLNLGLDLGKEYERVMRNAFNEASRAVAEQLEAMLPIPADADPREQRELGRISKTLGKTLGKALGTFGTKLLGPGQVGLGGLSLSADGKRLVSGPAAVAVQPAAASRFIGGVSGLRELLEGENPDLKKFGNLPGKLEAAYGDSLENNYFLSGNVAFSPNFKEPAKSEISYAFDLFAKRGKEMGMRVQFSVRHSFEEGSLSNELRIELPLQAGAAETPGKKTEAKTTKS